MIPWNTSKPVGFNGQTNTVVLSVQSPNLRQPNLIWWRSLNPDETPQQAVQDWAQFTFSPAQVGANICGVLITIYSPQGNYVVESQRFSVDIEEGVDLWS